MTAQARARNNKRRIGEEMFAEKFEQLERMQSEAFVEAPA